MKFLSMYESLSFGKHVGDLVGTVIEEDPSYIEWLLENTEYRLDEEALDY